eukprot:g5795.t1
MSDPQVYFDKAVATLQAATALDREKGDLQAAFREYMSGMEIMQLGFKYSKNERAKPLYRQKMVEVLKRAEEIKALLDQGITEPVLAGSSGCTTRSGDTAGVVQPSGQGAGGASATGTSRRTAWGGGSGGGAGGNASGSSSSSRSKDEAAMLAQLSGAIVMERPNLRWSDIAGLEEAKRTLRQTVELPLEFPHLFGGGTSAAAGCSSNKSLLAPWTGILLYGPPGTGKTYLAKAVASSSNRAGASPEGGAADNGNDGALSSTSSTASLNQDQRDVADAPSIRSNKGTTSSSTMTFLSVSAADLMCKFVGESPKLVKTLFEVAREKSPSVVFLDEIDSLMGDRAAGGSEGSGKSESSRQVLTEFLTQMDGVGPSIEGVLVMGATNTPWELDRAILSRFQKKIYIPLPTAAARDGLLRGHLLRNERHALKAADVDALVETTAFFSGRDLKGLVLQALQECVREFSEATEWVKVRPHPYRSRTGGSSSAATATSRATTSTPSEDYALAPLVVSAKRNCGTADHGEVIALTYEQLRGRPDLRERTILPMLEIGHFKRALAKVKASACSDDLKKFDEWTRVYGTSGV